MAKLTPAGFKVPSVLETDKFRLRMLTVNDVIKDYDAVMTSIEHLQETKPFGPNHKWPTEKLTLEQDLIDLGWHQKEFQKKTSFAFTVMSPSESTCLGCVYIYPSSNPDYDVMVMLWVRQSKKDLDTALFSKVKSWLNDEWPFKKVAFPGRDVSWDKF